jgi:hypothetical protein
MYIGDGTPEYGMRAPLRRRIHSAVLYLAAAAGLAGCAGPQLVQAQARPQFAQPFRKAGTVLITRPAAPPCTAELLRVSIDSIVAGDLGSGAMLRLYVQPGPHLLVLASNAACLGGDRRQTYIIVGAAQTLEYRTGFNGAGQIALDAVE